MNDEQIKALQSLERAFKKCRRMNIGFFVEESDIYAFADRDELLEKVDDHAWMKENLFDVDDHGTIIDCGAWA